jgi:hypothetical protein
MTDKPIFGGRTGEELIEQCAEQTATQMREAVVRNRGVEPSDEVMTIARAAARGGAVALLQELQKLQMIAPPAGWKP